MVTKTRTGCQTTQGYSPWPNGGLATSEKNYSTAGTSLVVWWLRHRISTAGGPGSIPGWRAKTPKRKKKLQRSRPLASLEQLEIVATQVPT